LQRRDDDGSGGGGGGGGGGGTVATLDPLKLKIERFAARREFCAACLTDTFTLLLFQDPTSVSMGH